MSRLIADLSRARVRIWVEDHRLHYQAPRGALTPELMAELRSRKADILAFISQAGTASAELPLGPAPRDATLQVSLAQHRLWLIDQMEGPNSTYNISLALRLRGALDISALRRSLDIILRRHETLRTCFHQRGDTACPLVAADCRLPWSAVDVQHLPAEQRLPEIRRRARDEALQPFDLGTAPLVRFVLWTLDQADHVLMVSMHHIISDRRSIEIIAGELSTLYNGLCVGKDGTLPELPIQYADFAWHQRGWLTDASLQRQLDYWRARLANMPPLLELPTDRPRPMVFSSAGASVSSRLHSALVLRLRQLAQEAGTTLYVAMLAGAAALLARHTGRDDIPIACAATHRDRPELDALVGFFVNTLVLRLDLSGDPSFRQLLRRVHAVVTEAFANQDVPFDKVVEALRCERNPGYHPLAQVSMVMLDAHKARPHLTGLNIEPFDFGTPSARHDLALELYETDDALDIFWIYATGLFDGETVERMARHLRNVLQAAVEAPDETLADLPLLDPAELDEVTRAWNRTEIALPRTLAVHQLFEAHARATPQAIALALEDRQLSYGELNAWANRLARKLMALDVGADVPVAICLDRSFAMVAGVLAVLKAGGAYLPLDPAYPQERLSLILADSGARVVLTDSRSASSFASGHVTVVRVDASSELPSEGNTDDIGRPVAANDLAYIIYTSGSTGRPKGCQIEHHSLMNYLCWADRNYHSDGNGGTYGLFTSLAFDLTVTAVFLPLTRGRMLRIFPSHATLDSILRAYFDPSSGLDAVKMTPAHITVLSSLALSETAVAVAVIGGEQLLPEHVGVLRKLNPAMRIFNEYGPTEATVGCIVKEVLPNEDRILIGRPIDNTRAYVLDGRLRPLPVGVPGELHIGGAGLARGYLGRPDLSAERFLRDPFSADPDARMYRTGDLARWLPSGDLECLGRTDHQVKIHGHRIELGEIEALLAEHPMVQQAAVVLAGDIQAARRLVAFVAGAPAPSAGELSRFLSARVPGYMVPSAFVVLDSLPLTVNGKIDRSALPPPVTDRAEAGDAGTLPRTETERTLAQIWARVLGRERIGIHDNFFALGGDSILCLQMVGQALQAGLRVSVPHLLQHPTVAGLAEVAEPARQIEVGEIAIGERVPLTPIQHWFFAQNLPNPQHYNQSLMLEMRQPLDLDLLAECVRHLASHHEALRMRFRHVDGAWRQEAGDPDRPVPFARIDVAELAPAARSVAIEARASELQAQLGLDGSLTRLACFECGPDQPSLLLWIIHHLVVDGVSWRILLEDLWTSYQQRRAGRAIQLPFKTTSFASWATRLLDHARSDAVWQEAPLWLAASPSPLLRLPLDLTDGANTHASERHVAVTLPQADTRALLHELPGMQRVHITELLLTALAHILAPWAGDGRLLLSLEGHGREHLFDDVDLSRTVGWFTVMTPVMLRLDRTADWTAALRDMQQRLDSIPHGGLGYGLLRYMRGEEALAERLQSQAAAELSFNYLGQLDQVLPPPFGPSRQSPGAYASGDGARTHLLDLIGGVEGGELRFRWYYSVNRHHRQTVEALAGAFIEALQGLIAHCCSPKSGSAAATDIRVTELTPEQFGKVAKLLQAAQARRQRSG